MNNKHCEWCDHSFEAKVNYQIYCSAECREAATREKINQNYLMRRVKKRMSKPRVCKSCGGNLSAYNDDALCSICDVNPLDVNKALKEIKGIIDETK